MGARRPGEAVATIGFALGAAVAGVAGDRFGRRPMTGRCADSRAPGAAKKMLPRSAA
jgi:hypothetical protein